MEAGVTPGLPTPRPVPPTTSEADLTPVADEPDTFGELPAPDRDEVTDTTLAASSSGDQTPGGALSALVAVALVGGISALTWTQRSRWAAGAGS